MGEVNYEVLVSELIKPLVTHPEDVEVTIISEENNVISLKVKVNTDDLGRIIGKKGRVANAIRTIVHAAAIREKKRIEIDLSSDEENLNIEE